LGIVHRFQLGDGMLEQLNLLEQSKSEMELNGNQYQG
jgi:hypothetical protein